MKLLTLPSLSYVHAWLLSMWLGFRNCCSYNKVWKLELKTFRPSFKRQFWCALGLAMKNIISSKMIQTRDQTLKTKSLIKNTTVLVYVKRIFLTCVTNKGEDFLLLLGFVQNLKSTWTRNLIVCFNFHLLLM